MDLQAIEHQLRQQSRCRPTMQGRELRVSSPFRAESDDGTFRFNVDTGLAHDKVSGRGYNARQLARHFLLDDIPSKLPQPKPAASKKPSKFPERAGKLLERSIDIPQATLDFLAKRGISKEAAADAGLRWAGAGAKVNEQGLLIPYKRGGELIQIRTRKDGRKGRNGKSAKYMSVTDGSGRRLYNGDAITEGCTLFIVESELDAIALNALGTGRIAVATGSVSGGRKDVDAVKRAKKVYIAFDDDKAGSEAAEWWVEKVGAIRAKTAGVNDVGEMFEQGLDVKSWLITGAVNISKALRSLLDASGMAIKDLLDKPDANAITYGVQSTLIAAYGVPRARQCAKALLEQPRTLDEYAECWQVTKDRARRILKEDKRAWKEVDGGWQVLPLDELSMVMLPYLGEAAAKVARRGSYAAPVDKLPELCADAMEVAREMWRLHGRTESQFLWRINALVQDALSLLLDGIGKEVSAVSDDTKSWMRDHIANSAPQGVQAYPHQWAFSTGLWLKDDYWRKELDIPSEAWIRPDGAQKQAKPGARSEVSIYRYGVKSKMSLEEHKQMRDSVLEEAAKLHSCPQANYARSFQHHDTGEVEWRVPMPRFWKVLPGSVAFSGLRPKPSVISKKPTLPDLPPLFAENPDDEQRVEYLIRGMVACELVRRDVKGQIWTHWDGREVKIDGTVAALEEVLLRKAPQAKPKPRKKVERGGSAWQPVLVAGAAIPF